MTDPSTTGTYLDRIVADVRSRLDAENAQGRHAPDHATAGQVRSLRAAIAGRPAGGLGVIAEIKRRSPSVGSIDDSIDPALQAGAYAAAGAAGISVLTEPDHFGGTLDDLIIARAAGGAVPILRKDFVVEPSQLVAARAAGADAVLLIAALHSTQRLVELVNAAHELSLEVLLEVHDEAEIERAIATSAEIIGINNRDLRSFVVDLRVTERLAPLVPPDRLIVAESGVRDAADARRMQGAGVDAVLVGEALMRSDRPGALLCELAAPSSALQENAPT